MARHQSWCHVPGWTRFKPAQQWLDSHAERTSRAGNDDMKAAFERFLVEFRKTSNRPALTSAQESALFQDFLGWWKARDTIVMRN